jgi:hypothetical protein
MWWRSIEVAASADDVWAVLTSTRTWPQWGPTVSDVRLDHSSTRIHAGSTGAVLTPLGWWAPFVVTDWAVDADRRAWSWRVAGVPATSHEVEALDAGRARLRFAAPIWAPAYLPVLAVGLRRLRAIAEARPLG